MVNQTNGKLGRVFFNNFQKQNCILKPLIIIEVVYRLKENDLRDEAMREECMYVEPSTVIRLVNGHFLFKCNACGVCHSDGSAC